MNITKEIIRNEKMNIFLNGNHTIESDLILPDYYGNINKVLKCTVLPICEATAYSDNKLSVSGIAKVSLLFSDEDFCLYNYETEIKYTKIFQTDKISDYDCFNVNQTVLSLNYRVLGPKHFDINASLRINVGINGITETELINDADDKYLSVKREKINCFQPSVIINREINADNDFPLDNGKKLKCIIYKKGTFVADEVKVIKDKTYIKGHCNVHITYYTEEKMIEVAETSVPVTEVFDTYNSNENDIFHITRNACDVTVTSKEGSEENTVLGISCNVKLILMTGTTKEIKVVTDAYSTKDEIICNYKDIEYIKEMLYSDYSTEILYETESLGSDIDMICDVFIEDVVAQIEDNSEGKLILITAVINAIVKRTDGSYFIISRKISAKESVGNDDFLYINACEVLSVNALQVSGGKIKFSVNLKTVVCKAQICKVNILSDVSSSGNHLKKDSKGIVLYFAEKNEEVWEIAKNNTTDINEIKALNSLENDVLDENKLLIFTDL